jgi:hypothetical protein
MYQVVRWWINLNIFQAGLGSPEKYRPPKFNHIAIAKISDVSSYESKKQVEVQLYNGFAFGGSVSVRFSDVGVKIIPKEGDLVLISYINGSKNLPIVLSFISHKYVSAGILTIDGEHVSINGTLALGTILDLEGKLQDLETRISALEGIAHQH